jgi:hypothetical protein
MMPHVDKMFDRDYLTPELLDGRDVTVTITSVVKEDLQMPGSSRKEEKWVLYFKGKDKGMVCNSTNGHDIARVTGETNSEDWVGKEITIFPTETKFAGQWEPCIRVRGGKGWKGDRR